MRDLTLVFDLDGTLVDTAPALTHATNHVLGHVGLAPVTVEALRPWVSYGARRMVIQALEASGTSLPEEKIDGLMDLYNDYYAANIAVGSRPYAGVVEALEHFRSQGTRLAVCTNKREELSRILLDALGMMPLFSGLAGRDTFPVSKPHPDHLLNTIRMAGGKPTDAIMVGDSEVDVATAKAARVPIVAVTFGYSEVPVASFGPDVLIESYTELKQAVAAVRSKA